MTWNMKETQFTCCFFAMSTGSHSYSVGFIRIAGFGWWRKYDIVGAGSLVIFGPCKTNGVVLYGCWKSIYYTSWPCSYLIRGWTLNNRNWRINRERQRQKQRGRERDRDRNREGERERERERKCERGSMCVNKRHRRLFFARDLFRRNKWRIRCPYYNILKEWEIFHLTNN